MKARHPYARPAVEDRAPLLERLLWSRDEHPIAERLLLVVAGAALLTETAYQVLLAIARHAADVSP